MKISLGKKNNVSKLARKIAIILHGQEYFKS